jgi:hypothetical protein
MPPGTYTYELAGGGGGGGGGGSNQKASCIKKKNGGEAGNGELKQGQFSLDKETAVQIVVGGGGHAAGDCGHGGSDNGGRGGNSYIKETATAEGYIIVANGGNGGLWEGDGRKNGDGNGGKGGLGGQRGGRDPQIGGPGWLKLDRLPI